MATKIVIKDGKAVGIWDDKWRPILESLGTIRVTRASNVEFDHATGDWVATLADGTDREIARGKSRSQVITDEVAYLEARL